MATPASSQNYQNPTAPLTPEEAARRAALLGQPGQVVTAPQYAPVQAMSAASAERPVGAPMTPAAPTAGVEARPAAPAAPGPETAPRQEIPNVGSAAPTVPQSQMNTESRTVHALNSVSATAALPVTEPSSDTDGLFEGLGLLSGDAMEAYGEDGPGKLEAALAYNMDHNNPDNQIIN